MRIVGGATNEAQLFIFENDGDNSYNLAYSASFPVKGTPVNGTLGALVVADADDTAGDEIYVFASGPTAAAGDSLFVVYSTGANTWANVSVSPPIPTLTAGNANSSGTAVEYTSAVAGDPDGDGNIELIVADDVTDGTFIWEVNGSWPTATLGASEPNTMYRSTATPAPGPGATAGQLGGSKYNVFLHDMNNNGREDILTATWNNLEFGIWEGTAANVYERGFIQLVPAPLDQPPMSNTTTAWNVDGVGFPTAYVGNSRTGDIYCFVGADPISSMSGITQGAFTIEGGAGGLGLTPVGAGVTFTEHPLQSLHIADVDEDGNAELVMGLSLLSTVGSATDGEVVLVEYNGAGADNDGANFTVHRGADTGLLTDSAVTEAVAGTPSAILDMDGDGLAEVVAVTDGASGFAIYVFEVDTSNVPDWQLH